MAFFFAISRRSGVARAAPLASSSGVATCALCRARRTGATALFSNRPNWRISPSAHQATARGRQSETALLFRVLMQQHSLTVKFGDQQIDAFDCHPVRNRTRHLPVMFNLFVYFYARLAHDTKGHWLPPYMTVDEAFGFKFNDNQSRRPKSGRAECMASRAPMRGFGSSMPPRGLHSSHRRAGLACCFTHQGKRPAAPLLRAHNTTAAATAMIIAAAAAAAAAERKPK